jgi:hypothetical protein
MALILLLAAQPLPAAPDPVRLAVYPRFSNAPGTIRVTLIIERNKDNRQACIDIEGDTGYSRSSCWEHYGDGARYQTVIYYPDLPAGRYSAVAEVTRINLKAERTVLRSQVTEFRLLGLGESEDSEP